ncbi:efflux RND transporter periplasmic adaptor subunit [Leptospira ognonensis]|uniref:Efflux RND transporter periplasmic adaptor subunit n=1 Tax=Leptospira ognonensis TaxID=2484945 RepID=A0A4R9JVV0_9LEPT|nr:efflux RND transporter periplasmic adaptor subunit [Leptospira ognonensis]TGL56486.1 efflux RND transporter periplasmic adaptor subunit [Leptospira ognonensis]
MIKFLSKSDIPKYGKYIFLLFFIFQIGFRYYRFEKLKRDTKEMAIPTVSLVQPSYFHGNENVTLPGTLKAWNEAQLYSQVSGYVKAWHKDYGAEVKKGTVLAEIQVPALDAEYEKAKAEVASQEAKYQLAQVTANRYLSLQKTNAVSAQAISEVLAEQNAEKAKLIAIQKNWEKWKALVNFKKIIAPFSGIVTQRNINLGDFVNQEGNVSDPKTAVPLYVVADVHKLRLFVSVPSTFSYLLKPGLKSEVSIPQFPDQTFKANFLTVAKGYESSSQTVLAEFELQNPEKKILPGSYAQVNLGAPVSSPYLNVPASSLIYQGNSIFVAILNQKNTIHFQPIEISRILDSSVEVKSGIVETDKVINHPRSSFLEGDLVQVVVPRSGY